ncbi:hypothetical protein TL16_g05558 [Triparma laevis f. inornata]|uniref:Myb-like domain-containing protein n=1 Tax=Triparma laevis f. inornata TaxID=1714386 RepID=A0A9W7ANK2_9STRA|nr:hypothetical protein TL16_g05558 [Triparma laevis f. inornata]
MGRPGPVLPSGAIAQIGNNGRAVNMLNKPSEKVVAASVELNTHTKRKLQDTILKNTLVEQPPKKKTRKWNVDGDPWTLEENTALLSGTKKHGLNFDRIKADNEVIFKLRTVRFLYSHLQDEYPKEFEAIKAASLKNSRSGSKYPWTDEEDEALVKGVDKHGLNFSRIRASTLVASGMSNAGDEGFERSGRLLLWTFAVVGMLKMCRKLSAVTSASTGFHPPIMPSFLFSTTFAFPSTSSTYSNKQNINNQIRKRFPPQ